MTTTGTTSSGEISTLSPDWEEPRPRGRMAKALAFLQMAVERGMTNYPACGLIEDGYLCYDLSALPFFSEDGGPGAQRRPVRIVDSRRSLPAAARPTLAGPPCSIVAIRT